MNIMILQIEDYNGCELGALNINPNNEYGEISVRNIRGDVSICDIDFDDIFDTNNYKLRIQLDNVNNRRKKAENIVDDIVSTRKGLIYDEEILNMYTTDFMSNEIEKIKEIVDEIMENHLEEDNLTIR